MYLVFYVEETNPQRNPPQKNMYLATDSQGKKNTKQYQEQPNKTRLERKNPNRDK